MSQQQVKSAALIVAFCLAVMCYSKLRSSSPAPAVQRAPAAVEVTPGGRLKFAVRRERRRRRRQPPQPPNSPPPNSPPLARAEAAAAASGSCALNGEESGDGCHGHVCLVGACFCAGGAGGTMCQRGRRSERDCGALEHAAYNSAAFAPYDVCAFYEPRLGIVRVTEKRWRAAQEAESALWTGAAGAAGSDRNVHHAELFDGYRALPDALGHVVEVGCGPFTQLQSVLRPSSTTSSITLVDPLVHKYKAKARACAYRSGQLVGRPVSLVGMQLEAFVPAKPADVLVMIAVLQSVQDVAAALQAAYNALRPGGWLVFADRVFDERWTAHAKGGAAPFWDVGHPCSPKAYLIDHFLAQFEEVHLRRHAKPKANARRGEPPDEQVYFIGRRKA